MRLIHRILIMLGCGFMLISCKDFLDINNNPNVATAGDPNLLFVSETLGMSNNRTSEIWIPIGISAQVFASGGPNGWGTDEDQYNISIFSTGNTWRELYTNAIKNGTLAIDAASKASPVNNNAIAQHKIIQAYAYWELTSIFGDVPFSEAERTDISQPKFDPQEDVLQGILNLLDDAMTFIDATSPVKITKEDLYYSGDMNKWKKFATTLKLRILMMMVDAAPEKSAEIKTLIETGGGFAANGDNALFPYFNAAGNYNPMYDLFHSFNGDVNNWLFDIDHTHALLTSRNDPRLARYFDPGPDAGGQYIPLAPAEIADDVSEYAIIGKFFLQPNSKDPLFTYSEYLLLQAEAHARGFTGSMADANTKLRAGIKANMQYYGVEDADITTFLAALPDLSTLSKADALNLIAEQQWLDLFNRPLECWTNWRRTEIPALTPPQGTLVSGFIRRWPYPPREVSANTNTPTQKQLDEKMWFDK